MEPDIRSHLYVLSVRKKNNAWLEQNSTFAFASGRYYKHKLSGPSFSAKPCTPFNETLTSLH